MSVEWKQDKVNVSCESSGWYPQPRLRWSDKKQDRHPESLIHSNGSLGVISVSSWILVSSFSEVSCSVGLPGGEEKVASLHLGNSPTGKQGKSDNLHVCKSKIFLINISLTILHGRYKEISCFFTRFWIFSGWMGGLRFTPHIHFSFSWISVFQKER